MESESSDSDPMDVGIGGEEEGYKSFEEEEGVEEYKSFESSSGEGSVQADRTTGGETASSLEEQQLPPQGSEVVEEARHGLDLARTAEEYAQYLVVNSKQDKQALDERIENVVFRVEEFKRQLEWMHQNITSCSGKTHELYEHTQQLKELFRRIDQVEAFVGVVHKNVDMLEEGISRAERELDPGKIRKVLSSLTKLRRAAQPDTSTRWQPPKVFDSKNYFGPQATTDSLSTPSLSEGGSTPTTHSPTPT